ncbi:asparagine--tRNA ligase [Candidatus Pacearchaeota archaeon RBG_16_35_8]|nr:MAG: asparagine--tRNA ligase [Candidatus Pacearchaeota archaeon RBG_16_35_8]
MVEKFISISEAMKRGKGKVAVRGWIHRERGSNELKFLVLRDVSDTIQCVLKKENFKKQWDEIDKLQVEASIEIEGTIKEDKRAPTGYEISADKINIIGLSDSFPINKDLNEELLGDRRHLWLRSRKMNAILKIRSTVTGALHEYFRSKGFYEFQSPIIIPGGAEDGPTMFEVNYFDRKMYLAQTWQLYAEAAMYSLEKIYCIAPSFRAEKSKTSRHLTEYWHTEMEVAWATLPELMDYAEEMTKHVIAAVLKNNKKDLEFLGRDWKKLEPSLKKKFPRVTYDEVLKILKSKKKMNVPWGKDLRTQEEDKFMEDHDTPVFVTNYPKEIMAFYKPRDPKNPTTALGFDMLGPEENHELIGGSVRDTNLDELKKSLKAKGEKLEDYEYYFDIHSYGAVPHGGYGLGTERLIKWICGLETIKDAIGFPRTMTRWKP